MSEEDLQDAAPLLLRHGLPEQLLRIHLSHTETQSPALTEALQLLHEGVPFLLKLKQQHLGGRKPVLRLRAQASGSAFPQRALGWGRREKLPQLFIQGGAKLLA